MVWRQYYTLQNAAQELSKQFGEEYTDNDILHYGAVELSDLCIAADLIIYALDDLFLENQRVIENGVIFNDLFCKLDFYQLRKLEKKGVIECNGFTALKSHDGEEIKPRFPKQYIELTKEFSSTWCGNAPIENCWKFFSLNQNLVDKVVRSELSFMDIKQSNLKIEINDLIITSRDFEQLKVNLREKIHTSKPVTIRAENKQAEIIAALAMFYTKTDCSKPFEAAETIRQEWERQATKLGNPPSTDTISKYIKQGINRLSST